MSSLNVLDRLSLAAPDGRLLFSDLTLSIGRQAVGLVGRNGSGKSTLLRAIAGEVRPVTGSISLSGRLGVAAALALLERIERGEGAAEDFDAADWMLPARIEAALVEVELGPIDLVRPIASFSGGERMRLGLARLLIEEPELILLDEPTNDLDRAGRDMVARLIHGWRGGALIASHDRELLEAVDHIVELSPVRVMHFGGGWGCRSAAPKRPQARPSGRRRG